MKLKCRLLKWICHKEFAIQHLKTLVILSLVPCLIQKAYAFDHITELPNEWPTYAQSASIVPTTTFLSDLSAGKNVHLAIHNEVGMDVDNIASLVLAAQYINQIDINYPELHIKEHVHFVSAYVYANLFAAYGKLILEKMQNDVGNVDSGIINIYAGYEPTSQEEFKLMYPGHPDYYGDFLTNEDDVKSGRAIMTQLLFNNIGRKAHGAFDQYLLPNEETLAPYAASVRSLSDFETLCTSSEKMVHIILMPAHSLKNINLRSVDECYVMGGSSIRADGTDVLHYNIGSAIPQFSQLLAQHTALGKKLNIIDAQWSERFKVSITFWNSLIAYRDHPTLAMTAFQKALLDHAIYWQAFFFNRTSLNFNDDVYNVKRAQVTPILSDMMSVLVVFENILQGHLDIPILKNAAYQSAPYTLTLNNLPCLKGGYLGTRASNAQGKMIEGYDQFPSDFFSVVPAQAESGNITLTEDTGTYSQEECEQLAEYYFLSCLCFSNAQRLAFKNLLIS